MALQKTPLTSSPAHAPVSAVANVAAVKPPVGKKPLSKASSASSMAFWVGLGSSLAWVSGVIAVIAQAGPLRSLGGVPLADMAVGISAAVSPVAMIWMITAYLQRAADIQTITDPLRRQMALITGESAAADARIRRFNEAIREQIDLLRNVQSMSQEDFESMMERVRQHRADFERFENMSGQQVKEIQDVVRRSMLQVEQMMDDKFTMLRVIDGKLQENGEGVASRVQAVGEQVTGLLRDIETSCNEIAGSLDRAQRDSQKLIDTAHLQESSLTNAATAASETLGGLSSKIDLSVARFLERASSAREEAERVAHALDAQTRTLDDFSATLPVRVSEAESVLRGVADRLYASEQLAREQAVNLGDRLSQQVDGLQKVLDGFASRLADVDAGLDHRSNDLNALSERIGATASGFFGSWEKSIDDLHDRMGNSLLRFTVVNDETRRNAETVTAHLNETTSKYEDVVVRMRSLTDDSGAQVKALASDMAAHLAQFEQLNAASSQASDDVQKRADAAVQNLQNMLDRVLSVRDATQSVGQTLVKDISDAVTQSEKMMQRLNDAAQLSARAISVATENFGRQESDLLGKARASEAVLMESIQKLQQQADLAGKGLREQTTSMMNLLAEAQNQLTTTDQKLQSFAIQAVAPVQKAMEKIDASTEQGLRSLGSYSEGMSAQVGRLQEFQTRIGGMTQEIGKATADSVNVFESLSERFSVVRTSQEEAARRMLAQFSEVSQDLQREVSGLDGHAAQAVELLKNAAAMIGEQSYQMMEKAKSSGEHIKDVSLSLQAEAAQIQTTLQKQAETVGVDLSAAERKFVTLGEAIREKADAARALLDQTVVHHGEVAEKMERSVENAQGKVEALHLAMEREANQISADASRIEKHAGDITSNSNRAVENLSLLRDRMVDTHDRAVASSQQTLNKLGETITAFQNSTAAMVVSAQTATDSVEKTGFAFDDRTTKLVQGGEQISGVLSRLTEATDALVEKAAGIRQGMEQQNGRLMMQLEESVSQLDKTGNDLQQIVLSATQGADQASARFAEMTQTASTRIDSVTVDLHAMTDRAEHALSALGANVTQQAASLAVVGDQLSAQQRMLADASEKQRAQMLDLFERLNAAHTKASEVADRSIATLAKSLKEVEVRVNEVDERSTAAVGNIKVASVGFSDQSTLLLQNAQAAEQQARAVLQVTSALQEQASQLRSNLQTESERAGESLDALLGRLTTSGAEVRTLGTSTSEIFSKLHNAFGEQTAELNGVMDKISERQRTLTTALDAQREMINILLNRLTTAQDQTASVAERAVSRLTEGAQQITQSVETIDARTQDALANVQKASAGFTYETEAIEKHARQIVQETRQVLASASDMHEQIGTLRTAMREEGETAQTTFGSLIDKIKTGSQDLRELSASTGASLSGLNDNVAQQNAILSSSMQSINERQTALVTALDAQRETISNLLNRFTQAQEETVTVAERTSARLNEEAQSITTSIDMIGAQASTTLTSIQNSVGGFAEQAVAIKMQSQEAEQQVRSMVSTTSGLQDQAKQLREGIKSEADRVAALLANVIDKLDSAGQQLKTQSGETTQALDQTSERLSLVSKSSADILAAQAQTVNDTIEHAETRMAESNAKMCDQMAKVAEAEEKAEAQTRQLANAADFATTRLVTLRDTIATTDKNGRDMAVTAYTRIEEIKTALQGQLQHLGDFSKTMVDQITEVTQKLGTESDSLRSNLASSESALGEAAEFVRTEAKQLPTELSRSIAEVENATRTLKGQAAEADQALVGTADRFITVTASVRDNMAEEMKRVSSVAEDAGKILNGFNQLLAEQVASMRQSTAMLSGEQQDLVEKASLGVGSLSEASQRLLALRNEASSTAERLVREFDVLDQRASMTGGRLAQAGEGIAKQVEAITTATAGAETRITSTSETLRNQLDKIRGGLQTQIDDINRGLLQITAQLERTGANLRSTAVGAVADVERVGQRFEQTGAAATAQVSAETAKMHKATEEVAAILSSFSEKFDQMIDHMTQAGSDIKYQEGTAIENLQRMLGHLGTIAEKLEAARSMSGTVSQQAIDRLDEVVTAVQAQMSKLTSGAQTAAGIMRGIGQIYNDQTVSLTKGVGDAHNQVLNMNKSIDDMQQRTDRMRSALKLQGEDLMNSLRQILTQLEMTGDGLTDAVNRTLQQQAVEGVKKIS